mmetsp:Transcript_31791/g.92072  ORF Transcript_31791/g.92072 Transcript_31791/m.92072 type:complete len:256 (-) Transcript_31791:218-985(-)
MTFLYRFFCPLHSVLIAIAPFDQAPMNGRLPRPRSRLIADRTRSMNAAKGRLAFVQSCRRMNFNNVGWSKSVGLREGRGAGGAGTWVTNDRKNAVSRTRTTANENPSTYRASSASPLFFLVSNRDTANGRRRRSPSWTSHASPMPQSHSQTASITLCSPASEETTLSLTACRFIAHLSGNIGTTSATPVRERYTQTSLVSDKGIVVESWIRFSHFLCSFLVHLGTAGRGRYSVREPFLPVNAGRAGCVALCRWGG